METDEIAPAWTVELQSHVRGTVATRGHELFHDTIRLFNAACKSPAEAVVLVLDAQDVSAVVQFALARSLSISVKSGGYNTAGWSLGGAIIIDLLALDDVLVHTPNAQGIVVVPSLDHKSSTVDAIEDITQERGRKRGETEAFEGEEGGHSLSERRSSAGTNASPLSFDNNPLLPHPIQLLNSNSTGPSRSSSTESSVNGERSGSGGELSEETGETSGEGSGTNQLSPDIEGRVDCKDVKGKGREVNSESRARSKSNSRGVSRDATDEGVRSWVANQARDGTNYPRRPPLGIQRSSGPQRASGLPYESPTYHLEESAHSYATSFADRPSPAAFETPSQNNFPFPPNSGSSAFPGFPNMNPFGQFPAPSISGSNHMGGGFGGISSAGFQFNPAALAPSSGPSSAGFVFNTAALASTSTLASPLPPISFSPALPTNPLNVSLSHRGSIPSLPLEAANLEASSLLSGSGTSPVSSNSTTVPFALVTIGTGAKSKQIDKATSQFSYHVPLAAYPVGCAIFASGGFGFLSRLHGLSMDNVVEVEMVMPDGRIVYLKEMPEESEDDSLEVKEMRELWWAYRGAGLTLGIITRVRAKAYHIGLVYSGNLIYPFNPLTTPSLIKHWRDCCKNAPRELYMNLILTAGPTQAQHVVVIQLCYVGARSEGDRFLQNVMSWEGERCLLKDVETRTFMTQQDSVVQILSAQAGGRWCIRADLMNSLPDECIHKTVAAFKNIPERSAWLFEIAAGAIADVDPSSSCFPASHRSAPFQVAAIHQWKVASEDELWTNAARSWINDIISPHSPGGSFPCFLESREGLSKIRSTFGTENWSRLEQVKAKLDPLNMMSNTFWPTEDDEPHFTCKK